MNIDLNKNVIFARRMVGLIQAETYRGNWSDTYYNQWDNGGFIRLLRFLNEEDNTQPDIRYQVVENHFNELLARMEYCSRMRDKLSATILKELVDAVSQDLRPDAVITKLRQRERGLFRMLEEESWGVVNEDHLPGRKPKTK